MFSDILEHLKEVSKDKPELNPIFIDEEKLKEISDKESQLKTSYEKEKGKLLSEIMDYKQYKKFVKNDLGFDGEDFDEFKDEITAKLSENGDKSDSDTARQLRKVTRELDKMKESLEEKEKMARELAEKDEYNTLYSTVSKALEPLNRNDLHTRDLINSKKVVLEDGEILFKVDGNTIDFEKGVSNYLEQNKQDKKSTQKQGAESTGLGDPVKQTNSENYLDMLKNY